MRSKKPNIPKLREQLNAALRGDKFDVALGLYDELAAAEPNDPRWPQRRGDLHRRMKHDDKAIESYEVAVQLYAKQGFVARAAAMAKLILQIDDTRLDVLARVDPDEARRLHREQRHDVVTAVADPSSVVPGPLPSDLEPTPMVVPPPPPSPALAAAGAAPGAAAPRIAPPVPTAPKPVPPPTAVRTPAPVAAAVPGSVDAPTPPPLPPPPGPLPPPRAPLPPVVAAPPPPAPSPAAAVVPPPLPGPRPPVPPPLPSMDTADREAALPRPRRRKSISVSAVDLRPVLDAEDDELRFSDVDEDEAIDIDLSAMELDDSQMMTRPSEEVSDHAVLLFDEEEDDDDRRKSAEQLAALPSISLFAEVPPAALSRLIKDADLIELGRGEFLIRAGDPADSLFVIVSGDLEVDWPGLSTPIPLTEGSVVGEACLLDAVTRRADVRTVTRVSALRIPKTVISEIVAEFPAVDEVLLELLTRRLIGNLLRTNPLFVGFDPDTRAELARLFEVRRATIGTEIFVQSKKTDGLYVPLLGRLDVTQDGRVLGRVRLGTVMGQSAILTRTPAESTVVAVTDALVLRLPAGRFNELAALYPTALMHLSEQSDSVDGEHISIIPGPA
ncbi:MAG: cyclic nucleotide-binding domain-containing protein [Myxococcales bacterium]|nr:cyclic nucleotide-binding domain-containing protein [Myxococcales bacterium]